jgi:hypothetical protein
MVAYDGTFGTATVVETTGNYTKYGIPYIRSDGYMDVPYVVGLNTTRWKQYAIFLTGMRIVLVSDITPVGVIQEIVDANTARVAISGEVDTTDWAIEPPSYVDLYTSSGTGELEAIVYPISSELLASAIAKTVKKIGTHEAFIK